MPESSGEYDVVVVGGGAAGIAATRRLAEAGRSVLLVEARGRLGGRARTIPSTLGHALDLGCEWLHSADRNPWTGIARRQGYTIDETLPDWTKRVARQEGAGAAEDWLATRERFDERFEEEAAAAEDRPATALLQPGGRWNALLGAISTWSNGAELERVSVKDHARYAGTDINWRLPAGYGAMIAAHGAGLPVRFDTAVAAIDHRARLIEIATAHGTLRARAVIVTLPTNLLAAGAIRFTPALPDKQAAAAGLPLGIANKLFLALDARAAPAGINDHRVGSIERVATGSYELRPQGREMIAGYFGGTLAAELEAAGPAAMTAFALDELAGLFGSAIRGRLKFLASSVWVGDPFANGSYSCALPGHAGDRAILAAPVEERLFFAGEATSAVDFSTAHGAYLTGLAAAERIIAL